VACVFGRRQVERRGFGETRGAIQKGDAGTGYEPPRLITNFRGFVACTCILLSLYPLYPSRPAVAWLDSVAVARFRPREWLTTRPASEMHLSPFGPRSRESACGRCWVALAS